MFALRFCEDTADFVANLFQCFYHFGLKLSSNCHKVNLPFGDDFFNLRPLLVVEAESAFEHCRHVGGHTFGMVYRVMQPVNGSNHH
jgi:hypothetical protein